MTRRSQFTSAELIDLAHDELDYACDPAVVDGDDEAWPAKAGYYTARAQVYATLAHAQAVHENVQEQTP